VKVYVDLVLFLNIAMDFIILLSVSIVLKRNVKFYRILLGSLVGGLSIFLLFLKLNNFTLFMFKLGISILMVLVSFSYKNIKYFKDNLLFLYLVSIILGGGIYLLDNHFNYSNNGLMFINSGLGINVLVLLLLSPFLIWNYIKSIRRFKGIYSSCYKVKLIYKGKYYNFNAFLDTGNRLYDPYKKRPIVLVSTKKIKVSYESSILVPYMTASGNSILKCVIVDKLIIDNKEEIDNVLVGISDNFHLDGVDMLLHTDILGGIK